MIKNFEQLGEVLADIENRLSYLENSQHSHLAGKTPEPREVETTVRHVSVYDFAGKKQVAKLYRIDEELSELKKYLQENPFEKKKPKRKAKYD